MRLKQLVSVLLAAVLCAVAVPYTGGGYLAQADSTKTIGNVTEFVESAENNNVLIFNSGSQQVKVELCTERTVRVQLSLNGDNGYRPYDPEYYMVQKNEWAPVAKTVTDEGSYIRIRTSAMEIQVQKDPLRIGMYDLEGNLRSKDTDDTGFYWEDSDTGIRGVKRKRVP